MDEEDVARYVWGRIRQRKDMFACHKASAGGALYEFIVSLPPYAFDKRRFHRLLAGFVNSGEDAAVHYLGEIEYYEGGVRVELTMDPTPLIAMK